VNQISPGQQPVKQENASPGWRHASDLNAYPHVDKARLLRANARRFWSSLSHQLMLAAAALLVVAAALAVPTTAFFGDHLGDKTRSHHARHMSGNSAPAARFYAIVLSYRYRPGYRVRV
jgi:hypothetical protein